MQWRWRLTQWSFKKLLIWVCKRLAYRNFTSSHSSLLINGKYGLFSLVEWRSSCLIHSNVFESDKLYMLPDVGWNQPVHGLCGDLSGTVNVDGVGMNLWLHPGLLYKCSQTASVEGNTSWHTGHWTGWLGAKSRTSSTKMTSDSLLIIQGCPFIVIGYVSFSHPCQYWVWWWCCIHCACVRVWSKFF